MANPVAASTTIVAARSSVLAGEAAPGPALMRALSAATDEVVIDLFDDVVRPDQRDHLALVATGGYGQGALAPGSDLDVILLHDRRCKGLDEVAASLWYPLWDAGLRLGHGVRTVDEQIGLAKDDLSTATALLDVRHLAGADELTRRLAAAATKRWSDNARANLDALAAADSERHARAGEVAYLLEPDLKDGIGGLRDAQSLGWARAAGVALLPEDAGAVAGAVERLQVARVALHQVTGRSGDVLRLEFQDAVAEATGDGDADEMMAGIAASARTIAWVYEQSWGGHRRSLRRRHRHEQIAPGVQLARGSIELTDGARPADDPTLMLATAIAAARHDVPIGRDTLDRLVAEMPRWAERYPTHWPPGALDELIALLLEGHRAIPVLETLDQLGLLVRLLPEWDAVRSKPQRNAYHRFTVDRHLWEAAANSADLAGDVTRPDLLVLGALFHDLGKGFPGDHTDVGVELFETIGPRLGLPPADVAVVTNLIRQHLLLPDVAVRRDLSDPATIAHVAANVHTVSELELLHALTVADSLATGPTAWSQWKAGLVAELVDRTRQVLGGADAGTVTWRLFPDAETLAAMAAGTPTVRISDDRVTVVTPDRPGMFARVAGAVSLCGVDVVNAQAHSESVSTSTAGRQAAAPSGLMAASEFRFVPGAMVDQQTLSETVHRALAGELALDARLAARARSARRRRLQAKPPEPPQVLFLDDASDDATVIEVRAPTFPGLLHRLAKALGEVGLDIRHATVQTVGLEAVDTFYVRNAAGTPVTDEFHRGEIERALFHALGVS